MTIFTIFANRLFDKPHKYTISTHCNVMMREQKYKAVVHFVEDNIISGKYRIGDRIPSVNSFKIRFNISRSSIFLAMDELKSRGLIESESAVGYYVTSNQVRINEKVLLLFNEFTSFKETIYNSFMAEINENTTVDIMFHNYNRTVFETLLRAVNGKYTTYVLMPGKFADIKPILSSIDGHIVLADHFSKNLVGLYSSVGQDFEKDTYMALKSGIEKIHKYKRIVLIQKYGIEPEERYSGIKRFCAEYGFMHQIISSIGDLEIESGDLFVTAEDLELVNLLKSVKQQCKVLGRDLGIISYNDTPVKEILAGGISTLTTDFNQMGRTLAHLVEDKTLQTIANPCRLIIRNSL